LLMGEAHLPYSGAADPTPDRPQIHGLTRRRRLHHLFQMQILVKLEPLTGQHEQRALADVQDGIADSLEELRHEQMGDEVGRILTRFAETTQRLRKGSAVVAIELGLVPARLLDLLDARLREGTDDVVEGGEGDTGRAGEVKGGRRSLEAGDVHG